MTTADLYEYWKDHYKNEGVNKGIELGVKQSIQKAYKTRFGSVPDDLSAALAATHDTATLDRWFDIVITGTPEEILRVLRASTASS